MKNPFPKDKPDRFVPKSYNINGKRKLPRDFDNIADRGFLDVILSRRSVKEFTTLSDKELASVLFFSNKIESIDQDESGYISSWRTAPSAGARHPIDLLVSCSKPSLEERTLEYYNPFDHSLNSIELDHRLLRSFLEDINRNIEIGKSAIIWFSIQPFKTGSKYHNPESLYWRDAGVLLYCIQLISSYLGIASCPLGTLASNSFNLIFDKRFFVPAGGILVGKKR